MSSTTTAVIWANEEDKGLTNQPFWSWNNCRSCQKQKKRTICLRSGSIQGFIKQSLVIITNLMLCFFVCVFLTFEVNNSFVVKNCVKMSEFDKKSNKLMWFEPNRREISVYTIFRLWLRVSVQGVESRWGDCRFIPADWGW